MTPLVQGQASQANCDKICTCKGSISLPYQNRYTKYGFFTEWKRLHPGKNVYEDRQLEITSSLEIVLE
jgi:hypothetical protein